MISASNPRADTGLKLLANLGSKRTDIFSLNHNLRMLQTEEVRSHQTLLYADPEFSAVLVTHASEITYVYGSPSDKSDSSLRLSKAMIDYWVSFANSLDPNDGLGSSRKLWLIIIVPKLISFLGPIWPQYTPDNEVGR